nr:Chain E, Polyadenylate-binding protein 1 [Homo sapiens]5LGR_F Chain F, Polyadenylate-binding protein 1 [Homo sapiens]5LGR_G Chain G, Polyadenylate-binding protein 1 [Homo sapiens]5LGR_H Chain H, Polyadenylate-binding protein 1 [Homo sapiens]
FQNMPGAIRPAA